MRTIQIANGFYRVNMGNKDYKIYVADLKMISKRRKGKKPALPVYTEIDNPVHSASPSQGSIPEEVAI